MDVVKKICINCPAGCHLEIIDGKDGISVSGNRCPRGVKYAENELRNPCRVVTATVLADAPQRCCVPVKSSAPVPMALIGTLLEKLSEIKVKAPICIGDRIIENYNGLGIDIVATGELK